jgi:hypothetical protein
MLKRLVLLGMGVSALGASASAHPTDVPYQTRGQCEAAFAESSKLDRERLVKVLGVFDTYGAAQRTFRDRFACEYDEEEGVWYIVDNFPMN